MAERIGDFKNGDFTLYPLGAVSQKRYSEPYR